MFLGDVRDLEQKSNVFSCGARACTSHAASWPATIFVCERGEETSSWMRKGKIASL